MIEHKLSVRFGCRNCAKKAQCAEPKERYRQCDAYVADLPALTECLIEEALGALLVGSGASYVVATFVENKLVVTVVVPPSLAAVAAGTMPLFQSAVDTLLADFIRMLVEGGYATREVLDACPPLDRLVQIGVVEDADGGHE